MIRPEDFEEDFKHENGQYMCSCYECGMAFIGHKRRVVCKICTARWNLEYNNLTSEQKLVLYQQELDKLTRKFKES